MTSCFKSTKFEKKLNYFTKKTYGLRRMTCVSMCFLLLLISIAEHWVHESVEFLVKVTSHKPSLVCPPFLSKRPGDVLRKGEGLGRNRRRTPGSDWKVIKLKLLFPAFWYHFTIPWPEGRLARVAGLFTRC